MARANSDQRPDRVPSLMPARAPARDTSWQGKPLVRMSTGSTWVQSIFVMSPWLGTPGKRCARIFEGAASNSENHAISPPSTACTPMPSPP